MQYNRVPTTKKIGLAKWRNDQGQLSFREALYVPDYGLLKLEIVIMHHDALFEGQPGQAKTVELISREFYWPKMGQYIKQILRNRRTYKQAKPARHSPFGNLKPIPIPNRPGLEVSREFVTDLPATEACDAILVVVDRVTKMRQLIPAMRRPVPTK